MFAVDKHINACSYARNATIAKYGDKSVPCTPKTEQHKFWLDKYDQFIKEH